jgi:putative component of toxin-antitoxin plasmid stabilization module/DNA-binding phage protein
MIELRGYRRKREQTLRRVSGRTRRGGSRQGDYSARAGGVGSGVFEYKDRLRPGYRIYFGKDGDRVVILTAAQRKGNNRISRRRRKLGRVQTEKETGDSIMPLTHNFKETIRARAQRDPDFRQALLHEAVECVINGDLANGKAVLRDYVNATVGFQKLEKRTQIPAKSLMRMLGPKGSPSAANLASILTASQKAEGVRFELSLRR